MRRLCIVLIAMLGFSAFSFSQGEAFKPSGKGSLKIFSNYHSTVSDGTVSSAFELTRAYLGYSAKLSENFSTGVTLDVGNPGVGKLKMTAYVKNAYVKYKTNNLNVNFGMITTTQFKVQEDFWGYRYLEKSFQDEYKFNSSADLGASIAYTFNDIFSLDGIIANGEGYKDLQSDSVFRYGLGATFHPLRGLTGRIYYDISPTDHSLSSITTFIGYVLKKFSLGAEYNIQNNVDFIADRKWTGLSVYATVNPCDKFKVFARYDQLSSNTIEGDTNAWNYSDDGQNFIAGVEYAPVKGIKITPNFKGWRPADNSQAFRSTFFLNCEFKF